MSHVAEKVPAKPLPGRAPAVWWSALGLIALVAAAYGRTLLHGLVSHDYGHLTHSFVQGRVGWAEVFTGPTSTFLGHLPGADRMYRPLLAVSMAADRWIWGLSAAGPHFTNPLLHLAVVLLVWRLAWRLTWRPGVAWFAAALSAVHPTSVEAVAGGADPATGRGREWPAPAEGRP